jgi:hypothetical protein
MSIFETRTGQAKGQISGLKKVLKDLRILNAGTETCPVA